MQTSGLLSNHIYAKRFCMCPCIFIRPVLYSLVQSCHRDCMRSAWYPLLCMHGSLPNVISRVGWSQRLQQAINHALNYRGNWPQFHTPQWGFKTKLRFIFTLTLTVISSPNMPREWYDLCVWENHSKPVVDISYNPLASPGIENSFSLSHAL